MDTLTSATVVALVLAALFVIRAYLEKSQRRWL
jgi:hypothetical protein